MIMLRFVMLACWLLGATAHADMRVFELRHADAEALLPLVQQQLVAPESASAYRNSLVVNAGAGTLRRVEELLRQLDRPLRNLLISVRRGGVAVEETQGAQAGANVHLRTGERTEAGGTVQIRAGGATSTRSGGGESAVRTLEGRPVLLREGELVPLAGEGYWGPGVQYRDVSQGFVLRARVVGQQVIVDIEETRDRVENGTVRTGALQSTVSGRPGEWIPLGGSTAASIASGSGTTTRYRTRGSAEESVEIRVELLDAPP